MGEKQEKKSLEIVDVQNTEEYRKIEKDEEAVKNLREGAKPKENENQQDKYNKNVRKGKKARNRKKQNNSKNTEAVGNKEITGNTEETETAEGIVGVQRAEFEKSLSEGEKTTEFKAVKSKKTEGENIKPAECAEIEESAKRELLTMEEDSAKKESPIKEEESTKKALPTTGETPKKRRKRRVAVIGSIFALIIIGAVSIVYYKGVMYYRTHFLPNTTINGIDCAEMDVDSIVTLLDAPIYEYKLEVSGRDYKSGNSGVKLGEIASEDIGLAYTGTKEAVESFLEQQEEYKWFFNCLGRASEYSVKQGVSFDESLLQTVVKEWDACKKGNMRRAEDAYIGDYSEELHGYEIIPETSGTELDVDRTIELIAGAVMGLENTLDVEAEGCYREAVVRRDDKKLTDVVDKANKWLGAEITYDWNGTEVTLDYETLKEWVSIERNRVVLDEEQVAAFVKTQASAYDTYGKRKNFVTALGVELTLPSRNYGWKTDIEGETTELLKLIRQGSVVEREPIYSITAMKKGASDIGNSYVEADLTNQHLYLYQDGELVLETDFVSGTMISTYDCVTPEGIFGLSYKTTNAVLRGATYATPVNYWMPFYGNYGMHDANWRGHFGGEIYKTNGSHGCINLPPSMAAQIYPYVSTGFPVICYYYDGAPYVGPPAEPVAPIDENTVWVEPVEEQE